ncbi:SMP-30/gluconolactonase/LRE family protein [Devosia sp.]|uniref:SMP-30/gluconolactonase/LRE family protein n=1 Tax=Devosia sp. TaxID=1871048 RepID=UPI003267F45E
MGTAYFTVLDERLRQLVQPNAQLERLHTGMLWAEGPVYFAAGDHLLWSDIPNNRVMQYVPGLGARVYSHDANNCNGNTLDREGRRITCEHLSRSVVRFEHDGSRTVLASQHEDKALNSPNDVVVSSDGAVWFTDPNYGIMSDYEGRRASPEQAGCFVYRIDPQSGAVEARITTMRKPNGLAFSLNERILYVADSARSHDAQGDHHVLAFPVTPGGGVGTGQKIVEIEEGVPDGFRLDEFGNLWVSSERGVEIFAPDGTPLGIIHVPETVANLTFGGPKNNRLFIAATTSLYAVYTAVRGAQRPRGPLT